MQRGLLLLGLIGLTACTAPKKSPSAVRAEDRKVVHEVLEEEMSLKEDRSQLESMRKDVPQQTKKANDELALFLNMMKQGTEQPHLVRERFHRLITDKRTTFREKVQRLREDFRIGETRRREDFMARQKSKRDSYLKSKRDTLEMRRFVSDQDRDRQRFMADERDRRNSFEAELNAQSKDFDSYMRERQNEFNEQFRLYSKKLSEKPKDKKAVTGEVNEFQKLREIEASPLGTEN